MLTEIINSGYEPAFVNEVLSYGDNMMRKAELLIKRCGVIIFDISKCNPYTEWENSVAKEAGKK